MMESSLFQRRHLTDFQLSVCASLVYIATMGRIVWFHVVHGPAETFFLAFAVLLLAAGWFGYGVGRRPAPARARRRQVVTRYRFR